MGSGIEQGSKLIYGLGKFSLGGVCQSVFVANRPTINGLPV